MLNMYGQGTFAMVTGSASSHKMLFYFYFILFFCF